MVRLRLEIPGLIMIERVMEPSMLKAGVLDVRDYWSGGHSAHRTLTLEESILSLRMKDMI